MILILLVSFVVVFVAYSWNKTQYWRRRGINGPPSKMFLGNLHEISDTVGEPMPLKFAEWSKKYGKVYGIQRGFHNTLILSDPSMAKEIFVEKFENFHERDTNPLMGNTDKASVLEVFNSRGLRWKRLRALTALAFTTKSLKKVFPIVNDSLNKLCDNLEEDLKSSPVVNIALNIKEFAADVILQSAFGRNEDRKTVKILVDSSLLYINSVQNYLFPIGWAFPLLGYLLTLLNLGLTYLFNRPLFTFFKKVWDEIGERKEKKENPSIENEEAKDFIDLLIEAESGTVTLQNNGTYNKKDSHIEKHLTKGEILGTCFIFLGAGFDPIANTLSHTIYYLAKNQEIQEKARAEVEEFCLDEELDYDSLNQLKYLDALVKETLRLHPSGASATSRRCAQKITIGGIEIEKGTDVILDVVSMHRNKEIWGNDAEEYNPERWLDSDAKLGNFLGFGDGLRICVGMRFALLEQKTVLVKILRRYRIFEVPETKEAEEVIGINLAPKSVKVRLERI